MFLLDLFMSQLQLRVPGCLTIVLFAGREDTAAGVTLFMVLQHKMLAVHRGKLLVESDSPRMLPKNLFMRFQRRRHPPNDGTRRFELVLPGADIISPHFAVAQPLNVVAMHGLVGCGKSCYSPFLVRPEPWPNCPPSLLRFRCAGPYAREVAKATAVPNCPTGAKSVEKRGIRDSSIA